GGDGGHGADARVRARVLGEAGERVGRGEERRLIELEALHGVARERAHDGEGGVHGRERVEGLPRGRDLGEDRERGRGLVEVWGGADGALAGGAPELARVGERLEDGVVAAPADLGREGERIDLPALWRELELSPRGRGN